MARVYTDECIAIDLCVHVYVYYCLICVVYLYLYACCCVYTCMCVLLCIRVFCVCTHLPAYQALCSFVTLQNLYPYPPTPEDFMLTPSEPGLFFPWYALSIHTYLSNVLFRNDPAGGGGNQTPRWPSSTVCSQVVMVSGWVIVPEQRHSGHARRQL